MWIVQFKINGWDPIQREIACNLYNGESKSFILGTLVFDIHGYGTINFDTIHMIVPKEHRSTSLMGQETCKETFTSLLKT
jgi:hypothetical protein